MNEINHFDFIHAKRQFGRIGGAMAAFIGSSLISQIILTVCLAYAPAFFRQNWVVLISSFICSYGIGMPLAISIINSGPKCTFYPTVKMRPVDFIMAFSVVYAIAIAGNLISTVLMDMTGNLLQREIVNPVSFDYDGVELWLEFFGVLVLAPVLEELLFRKSIVDSVLPYGEGTTILLSAVTFGMAHGNFFQFFYAAGIGALFAYIYIRTGKIRNTIILHFLMNFMGGVAPALILRTADSGKVTPVMFLFEFALLGLALAGVIVFIANCKKLYMNKPTFQIPQGRKFSTIYLNPGMIIFVAVVTLLFISNMFL